MSKQNNWKNCKFCGNLFKYSFDKAIIGLFVYGREGWKKNSYCCERCYENDTNTEWHIEKQKGSSRFLRRIGFIALILSPFLVAHKCSSNEDRATIPSSKPTSTVSDKKSTQIMPNHTGKHQNQSKAIQAEGPEEKTDKNVTATSSEEAQAQIKPDEPINAINHYTDSRDGKVYKTTIIMNQKWFAQNLDYSLIESQWCYDNIKANCKKYGALYTWDAAKSACPSGWHLPTKEDWNQLVLSVHDYRSLIDRNFGRGKDLYKFNITASGKRGIYGSDSAFSDIQSEAYYWTSTENRPNEPVFVHFSGWRDDGNNSLPWNSDMKSRAFSIRCISD